jgi:hypothetical protein
MTGLQRLNPFLQIEYAKMGRIYLNFTGDICMIKKYPFLMAIVALLLATLACSLAGGAAQNLPEGVLFQDDFSDSSSGWDQVNSEEGITDYENGVYRIWVNATETDIWANPGLDFTNVVVEVDANKIGGPDDNDFGVICRYQDIDNFYFFIISSDGFYAIGKVLNGEYNLLGMEQMLPDDAIKQGNATNHIKADCVGSHLVLHANGSKLADVEDATFASGDVGLIAGTFGEIGVDIHFDNFVVRGP